MFCGMAHSRIHGASFYLTPVLNCQCQCWKHYKANMDLPTPGLPVHPGPVLVIRKIRNSPCVGLCPGGLPRFGDPIQKAHAETAPHKLLLPNPLDPCQAHFWLVTANCWATEGLGCPTLHKPLRQWLSTCGS